MFSAQAVLERYDRIADMYGLLALLHHLALGVILALVFRGNRRPGHRLLSLVVASMSFSVFWTSQEFNLSLSSIVFLVLLFCAGYDVAKPLTAWTSGDARPKWVQWSGWFGLAWAWIYPHHVAWWKVPLASPLGVLPLPTLLALVSLLWLAFPQTNRLLHWGATLAGVVFGMYGLFYLGQFSGLFLLALSGVSLWALIQAAREAGGIFEEDLTPEERPKSAPKKSGKETIWRL